MSSKDELHPPSAHQSIIHSIASSHGTSHLQRRRELVPLSVERSALGDSNPEFSVRTREDALTEYLSGGRLHKVQ